MFIRSFRSCGAAHNFAMRSYNDTMDTIIYLRMNRKWEQNARQDIFPAFHIHEVKGEPHLICVEIPRQLAETEPQVPSYRKKSWPARLAAYLYPFVKNSASADTVLDRTVSLWLDSRGLWEWWEQSWPYPEYRDYRRPEYARLLFQKGMEQIRAEQENQSGCGKRNRQVQVYVLGYEDYVPELLSPYAARIKSLTFVEKAYNIRLEEYLELLYEEEGLAASCQLLMEGRPYRTMRLSWQSPAVVLDLTGDERLMPSGNGQGLFWIDMDSQEEKRRRLKAGCSRLTYFSMKEEWRSSSLVLDTVPENGYNTEVNQGIFGSKR